MVASDRRVTRRAETMPKEEESETNLTVEQCRELAAAMFEDAAALQPGPKKDEILKFGQWLSKPSRNKGMAGQKDQLEPSPAARAANGVAAAAPPSNVMKSRRLMLSSSQISLLGQTTSRSLPHRGPRKSWGDLNCSEIEGSHGWFRARGLQWVNRYRNGPSAPCPVCPR